MNERRLTRQCRTICSPSACRVYRARSVSNCSSLLHSDHVSRCRAPLFPGFNIANAMVSNTSQEATAVRLPPTGRTLCQSNASKSRGSNFALYRHFASTSRSGNTQTLDWQLPSLISPWQGEIVLQVKHKKAPIQHKAPFKRPQKDARTFMRTVAPPCR